ncbi:MAG: monovalent cation/H(+) antiporter subunit G [Oscillospiraceae bacterium]|nr:monovalent cation/H(+) antiporter subunit G [Oscillospiraceae bacterium]MBP3698660.1 monovalent cation/H(+) antiporter subunit G [Oscillospiraceae bacterium]
MMFLEWLRFILVALCMLGGMFTMIVAILGLYRFDFALNRIHSAAMGDTLSLFLFVLGLVIAVGWNVVALKLVLVLVLQWLTSPLSSHMLAQFEYHADEHLEEHIDLSQAQFRQESDTEEVAAQ